MNEIRSLNELIVQSQAGSFAHPPSASERAALERQLHTLLGLGGAANPALVNAPTAAEVDQASCRKSTRYCRLWKASMSTLALVSERVSE